MESIKIFYKFCPDEDVRRLDQEGAIILDVRTAEEFLAGHIEGSINIPLDELLSHLHLLPNKSQGIITCCATGMRSASAKILLESLGYTKVCNGGSWVATQEKLNYANTPI